MTDEQPKPDEQAGSRKAEVVRRVREAVVSRRSWILVADDNAGVRRSIARSVQGLAPHVRVVEASDGEIALKRLATVREQGGRDPALIITDLEMPNMDGWELILALRKDYTERGCPQGAPLIVLSSTGGTRGFIPPFRKSIHGGMGYEPMVTVAKGTCLKPWKYDGRGEEALCKWIEHFLAYGW